MVIKRYVKFINDFEVFIELRFNFEKASRNRPIAITSILYKGFKAFMTKNITKHIDS